MAEARQCDICNEYYTPASAPYATVLFVELGGENIAIEFRTCVEQAKDVHESRRIDLCEKCRRRACKLAIDQDKTP